MLYWKNNRCSLSEAIHRTKRQIGQDTDVYLFMHKWFDRMASGESYGGDVTVEEPLIHIHGSNQQVANFIDTLHVYNWLSRLRARTQISLERAKNLCSIDASYVKHKKLPADASLPENHKLFLNSLTYKLTDWNGFRVDLLEDGRVDASANGYTDDTAEVYFESQDPHWPRKDEYTTLVLPTSSFQKDISDVLTVVQPYDVDMDEVLDVLNDSKQKSVKTITDLLFTVYCETRAIHDDMREALEEYHLQYEQLFVDHVIWDSKMHEYVNQAPSPRSRAAVSCLSSRSR